jgi:hypothetical protein
VATSEEEPVASYFLPSMSALGQLPHTLPIHSCHANVRALPPKADMQQCKTNVRFGSLADICSAKGTSALPPIATAKADSRKRSCPLYPRKRTCAVQLQMSALGQ